MKSLILTTCSLLFALGTSAMAAPISYDEAVDGDINGASRLFLTADAGLNTVVGQVIASASGTDVDFFQINTPFPLDVLGGSFTSTVTGPDGGFVNSSSVPILPSGIFLAQIGSGFSVNFDQFDAGLFQVRSESFDGVTDRIIDYRFEFIVGDPSAPSIVPLPASGLLLVAGLGALSLGRRAKRKTR
ncbi:MAG: VPLPA-CTERM sorting domain-containing protein [Pseudomonadota bacterium]